MGKVSIHASILDLNDTWTKADSITKPLLVDEYVGLLNEAVKHEVDLKLDRESELNRATFSRIRESENYDLFPFFGRPAHKSFSLLYKTEKLVREAIQKRVFDNYFKVVDGSATDLGSQTPTGISRKDHTPMFAIVIENRNDNTTDVIVTTVESEEAALKRATGIVEKAKNTKIVAIVGRSVGTKDDETIYKDVVGVEFTEDDLEESAAPSGVHAHPHIANGEHDHTGLPLNSGGHLHQLEAQLTGTLGGGHSHREGDPNEGFHFNDPTDNGSHFHVLALMADLPELQDWMVAVIDAHFPRHLWLEGHVRTWVQHIGRDPEPVLADKATWGDHFMWNHSSGMHLQRHDLMFLNPDKRFMRKFYEFEDGVIRPAMAEDFRLEEVWLDENLPFPMDAIEARFKKLLSDN